MCAFPDSRTRILPRPQSKDLSHQRPTKRHIGNEHGGGGLAVVPSQEDKVVGHDEVVVAIEHGEQDDDNTEAKDAAEDKLSTEWETTAGNNGQRNCEHQDVRRHVQDCDGYEVVVVGFTLFFSKISCEEKIHGTQTYRCLQGWAQPSSW